MEYIGKNYLKYTKNLIAILEKNRKNLHFSNDIESVHKMRTSIRKLRGVIKLFSLSKKFDSELKKYDDSLSLLRDLEVQLNMILTYPESEEIKIEKLFQWELEKNRVLKQYSQFEVSSVFKIFFKSLKRKKLSSLNIYEKIKKVSSPILRVKSEINGNKNDKSLHLFRIKLKKLVYLLEALTVEQPKFSLVIKKLKKYQDILGEIHDFQILGWKEKAEESLITLTQNFSEIPIIIKETMDIAKYDSLKDFVDLNLKNLLLSENEINFLTVDFKFKMEACKKISNEFSPEKDHISRVTEKSLNILEILNPIFSFTQEERELLELSALLHDIGHFFGEKNHNEESKNMIYRSKFLGLDFVSKIKLGWIVENHRGRVKKIGELKIFTKNERERLEILVGILRVADGMELESLEYMINYYFQLRGNKLLLNSQKVSKTLKKRFISKSKYLEKRSHLKIKYIPLS